MNIELDVGHSLVTVPASDLLNYELQLVEKLGVNGGEAWPDALLIVIEEVADLEMLGDWNIEIGGSDLQKPFGRRLPAANSLGEIGTDAIAVKHTPFFFLEWDQNGESEAFNGPLLIGLDERHVEEAGFGGRVDLVAAQWLAVCCKRGVADANPGVLQRRRVTVDIEWI